MNPAIQIALDGFVMRSGVLAAAVADARSGEVWSAGEPAAGPIRWIYDKSFGSPSAVRPLADFLTGKEFLPQMTSQGEARGSLSLSGPWVFGAFYVSDPLEASLDEGSRVRRRHERAQELSAALWRALEPTLKTLG